MTSHDVEVVPAALTADEARAITAQIRGAIDEAWVLITAAYQGRAWVALGYDTWDNYVDSELKGPIRLPREKRQEVVQSLHSQGMSTRAIAAVVGVDQSTVVHDEQVMQPASPAPEAVQGTDGKRYKARQAPPPKTKAPRVNHDKRLDTLVHALHALVADSADIDTSAIDIDRIPKWRTSLSESMQALQFLLSDLEDRG